MYKFFSKNYIFVKAHYFPLIVCSEGQWKWMSFKIKVPESPAPDSFGLSSSSTLNLTLTEKKIYIHLFYTGKKVEANI